MKDRMIGSQCNLKNSIHRLIIGQIVYGHIRIVCENTAEMEKIRAGRKSKNSSIEE